MNRNRSASATLLVSGRLQTSSSQETMSFNTIIDPFVIAFYRLTGIPILDFYLGTFILSLMATVIGEFTISLYFLFNRKDIERTSDEVIRMQNLSILALKCGDKASYKACNKNANDAFGRAFFKQIAIASSSLWPVPFALQWMQTRFSGVELELPFSVPFVGNTVNYPFVFVPIYILSRILFGKVKPHLPYFKRIHQMLKRYDRRTDSMESMAELLSEGRERS
ncbi:MAG: hypothetical protein V1689_11460 [Pseudomonadota bacterium]